MGKKNNTEIILAWKWHQGAEEITKIYTLLPTEFESNNPKSKPFKTAKFGRSD